MTNAYYTRPYIMWDHNDGPALVMRNGELHWLTKRERIRIYLKLEDACSLERKLWRR